MLARILVSHVVFLISALGLYATDQDRAVRAFMRNSSANIRRVQILKRVAVDQGRDLCVVLGTPNDRPAGKSESAWWGNDATLGIFLQRSTRTHTLYKIALRKGEGDCETRVENVTPTDVVLSCSPEKGARGLN